MDTRIGILFAVEIAKVRRAIGIKVVHEARQGEGKETRLYNNVPPLQPPMSRDSKLLDSMDNQSTVENCIVILVCAFTSRGRKILQPKATSDVKPKKFCQSS